MPQVCRTAPWEKLAGTGLVPLITLALVALFLFLPRIDPLRKNYDAFRDWYNGFIGTSVLIQQTNKIPRVLLWRCTSRTA